MNRRVISSASRRVEDYRIAVLFDDYGYRTLLLESMGARAPGLALNLQESPSNRPGKRDADGMRKQFRLLVVGAVTLALGTVPACSGGSGTEANSPAP